MSDVNTDAQSNEPQVDNVPSVRDSIAAAFEKQNRDEGQEEAPVVQEANSINGPARDEHGRFAKKEGEEDAPEASLDVGIDAGPDVAEPEPEKATPAFGPPSSWSVAAKAEFDKLPDAVKADIAKREDEVNRGFARLKELKELEPYQQYAAQFGTTLPDALRSYIEAEKLLTNDPVQGVAWLIRQYRPDLNQLLAAVGVQGGQSNARQPDPTGQLAQELQALKRQWAQKEQQEQANRTASLNSEIETFATNPEHRYFENVRPHMAALMQNGSASTLAEAYEMACWASPEVRAQLQRDQFAKQEAERLAKSQQAVQAAKRSAGSITGSPMPGGSSAGQKQAPLSIRDSIAAAMEKQQARA